MQNIFLSIFISISLIACSTVPASTDGELFPKEHPYVVFTYKVEKGDNVIIHTKDNNKYQFKVIEISESEIIGKNEKVRKSDITLMELDVGIAESVIYGIGNTVSNVVVAIIGTAILITIIIGLGV